MNPTGYLRLHPDDGLNFQMNRLAACVPMDELKGLADRIASLEDWIRELSAAAARAEDEGRLLVAATLYRGVEFYLPADDPRKSETYARFLALHDQALPEVAALRLQIPYRDGALPVLDIPARGAFRGVILAHSGFDGLAEEMYPITVPLAEAGYRVLLFEGPGQGAPLRRHGLPMPHDWEQPVAAVLDHFGIEECTLIGMSLGGYLAPRAAAFEPRIRHLVAWGAMYDFMDCFARGMGAEAFAVVKTLLADGQRETLNQLLASVSEINEQAGWAIGHGMHVSGGNDPFDFLTWLSTINLREVSHRITQDTLIVMGASDHLVPREQLYRQAEALTAARSVTTRLSTQQEQAGQHCQVGNPGLVTEEILSWLDRLDRRDAPLADLSGPLVSDETA